MPPVAFCALAADNPRGELLRPLFRTLGDASYSIYLTHSFLLGVSGRIWARLFGPAHAGWFLLAMVVGCSFLGVVVYRLVEKPLLSALRTGCLLYTLDVYKRQPQGIVITVPLRRLAPRAGL